MARNVPARWTGFGHLSWHLAWLELGADNIAKAFRLHPETFALEVNRGTGASTFIDAVSFLWRAELAAYPRDTQAWAAVHDFSRKMVPKRGNAMADWHMALTDAVVGDSTTLETRARRIDELGQAGRYGSGETVPSLSRGFAAFQGRTTTLPLRRPSQWSPRLTASVAAGRSAIWWSSLC
jgi:hypothetical protein